MCNQTPPPAVLVAHPSESASASTAPAATSASPQTAAKPMAMVDKHSLKPKKRVSFGGKNVTVDARVVDADSHDRLDAQLKERCWYSSDELEDCREEARLAVEALHEVGGNWGMVDEQIICVRGLEKYSDVVSRMMTQRRLVESVLKQQARNKMNGIQGWTEGVAAISRVLSEASIHQAQVYALRSRSQSAPTPTISVASTSNNHQNHPTNDDRTTSETAHSEYSMELSFDLQSNASSSSSSATSSQSTRPVSPRPSGTSGQLTAQLLLPLTHSPSLKRKYNDAYTPSFSKQHCQSSTVTATSAAATSSIWNVSKKVRHTE